MKNFNIKILVIVITITIPVVATSAIFGRTLLQTDDWLSVLMNEKQKIVESKGIVPSELEEKIHLESEAQIRAQDDLIRCSEEVGEIERMRKSAPIDEKGNPILPENIPDKNPPAPHIDIGYIGGPDHAITFFPADWRNYVFYSTIITPYDILVSGKYNDKEDGFILNVRNYPDGSDSNRTMLDLKGIDYIYFKELVKDNTIVIFTYNENKEGYFDLTNGTVILQGFSEY